jgi:hypothetical protein
MVHKKLTSPSSGAADKIYGVDYNKLIDHLERNTTITDPFTFNVNEHTFKDSTTNAAGDLLKGNGTKFVRLARGSANQVLGVNAGGTDLAWTSAPGGGEANTAANVGTGTGTIFRDKTSVTLNLKTLLAGTGITITNNTNDITLASTGGGSTTLDGLTDVAITSAARGDIIVRDATQFVNKAKGTANQVLTMDGTGTDPVWSTPAGGGGGANVQAYSYFVYVDAAAGNYKALNAVTGAVDYTSGTSGSNANVGALLSSIFTGVSASVPLSIVMGKGDFVIRSWDANDFRRGNFSITGQGQNITRFMVTNDIETAGGTKAMTFEPSAGSTTTNLTANCTKGSASISVTSASGFAVGDYIILCSDEDWDTAFAAADKTQLNKIVSISGTTIMLEKFASETFNTANTARIIKQTVLQNIYLANFSMVADPSFTNIGTTFLRFDLCDNVLCENIGITNPLGNFHVCFVTNMIINSTFRNFYMVYNRTAHFTTSGPYAISCRAACENVLYENFRFIGGWRHCFTTTTSQEGVKDGVPKDIFLVNCVADTCSEAAFDTHGEGENIHFINCAVHGYRSADSTDTVAGTADTDAFNTRCKHVSIINPMVTNTRGRAISITTAGYGIKIHGGYIRYIRNGQDAIRIEADSHDIQISDVDIDTVDNTAIFLEDNVYNVQINNVKIKNVCTANNTLSPIETNTGTHDVQITNMMIDTSNDSAIMPISLNSGSRDFTLSNITLLGAGTDCGLSGFNHKLSHWTCTGRNLERPIKKYGRYEGVSVTGSTSGLINGQITNAGGSKRVESTDGNFMEFATATVNTVQGIKTINFTERDLNPYLRFVFRMEQTTGVRLFLMFSSADSAVGPAGTDPLDAASGFGLKLDSGGSNFVIYHNDGTTPSTTGANIAAVDTNKHTIELRANNANSGFQYRWDNGNWSSLVTSNIPAAATDLCIQAYMENNETTVNKTLNLLEVEVSHDNK